jgi:hypothetical protein
MSLRKQGQTGAGGLFRKANTPWLKGAEGVFVRSGGSVRSRMDVYNLLCAPVSHMHRICYILFQIESIVDLEDH